MAIPPKKRPSSRKKPTGSDSRRPPSTGPKSSERSGSRRRAASGKRSRPISVERSEAGSLFDQKAPGKNLGRAGGSSKAAAKKTPASEALSNGHRLQQVLAAAGFGSRRACEELILDGRVDVDGVPAELGMKVFPVTQKIRVDGEPLPKIKPVYLAVNKPKGVLCTNRDQQGRRRVIELVPQKLGRVFPIGRLDQESEGLILLTNDGALCERLAHPRYEVAKKYHVQVAGLVEQELIDKLKKGIHIAEGIVQADEVAIKARHKQSSILEITLREGKNREIRRMLARIGHKVMHLKRVAIGPVKLGKLLPGDFRPLTRQEVARLYADAKLSQDR